MASLLLFIFGAGPLLPEKSTSRQPLSECASRNRRGLTFKLWSGSPGMPAALCTQARSCCVVFCNRLVGLDWKISLVVTGILGWRPTRSRDGHRLAKLRRSSQSFLQTGLRALHTKLPTEKYYENPNRKPADHKNETPEQQNRPKAILSTVVTD